MKTKPTAVIKEYDEKRTIYISKTNPDYVKWNHQLYELQNQYSTIKKIVLEKEELANDILNGIKGYDNQQIQFVNYSK